MRALQHIKPESTYSTAKYYTEKMKLARTMNRIAVRQIKDSVELGFSKATAEHLKHLTSESVEATYSRVRWTNTKDGKIYHLLKECDTPDGNIIISILDTDGEFIKKAVLKPKNIVILDCSSPLFTKPELNTIPELSALTHIDAVEIFARRNNPFANYEVIDLGTPPFGEIDNNVFLKELLHVKSEPNIDYINCSIGADIFSEDKTKIPDTTKYLAGLLEDIASSGTRVIISSGNGHSKSRIAFDELLISSEKFEGVGSLSPEGIISNFSASRNYKYTQHYEIGEVKLTSTSEGINITGIPGTDIKYQSINPFIGKTLERINRFFSSFPSQQELKRIHGKKRGSELFKRFFEKYQRYNEYVRKLQISSDTSIAELYLYGEKLTGTSFSAPARTAKLALNDMMEGII